MSCATVVRGVKRLGKPLTAVFVRRAIAAALSCEGIKEPCHVDVLLTDDDGIRELNFEARGVADATDVLSFPLNELRPGAFDPSVCERDLDTGRIMLGDMAISVPRCKAQGEEYGHGYRREVSYLAVHSTLHLLGYDHVDEGEDKRLMRAHEDAVMERLGISK